MNKKTKDKLHNMLVEIKTIKKEIVVRRDRLNKILGDIESIVISLDDADDALLRSVLELENGIDSISEYL